MPPSVITPQFKTRSTPTSADSLLLAVLCLVAVLSIFVIPTVSILKHRGNMQQAPHGGMRAEMGVAVAGHPVIKAVDPLLRRNISGVERFEVFLSTEQIRMNLNAEALDIAATLLDWTDPDDLKRRPDSAVNSDYDHLGFAARSFNRKFSSLNGVGLVARGPRLRVESISKAAGANYGIAVIIHKNGGMPRIAEWREFPAEGARRL